MFKIAENCYNKIVEEWYNFKTYLNAPYLGLGLLQMAPAEIPSWELLSGVVALGYLVSRVNKYREQQPCKFMQRLDILKDKITCFEFGYKLDWATASELGVEAQYPCNLSPAEYRKIKVDLQKMYLEKTAFYNISKNLKPIQASYRALKDIWKEYRLGSDAADCLSQKNFVKITQLYELTNLYEEITQLSSGERILTHYRKTHKSIYGENNNSAIRNYLVNQSEHSGPAYRKLKNLWDSSVALTVWAGGMATFGLINDGVVPERTRFLGGLAALTLGAYALESKKHIKNEINRFQEMVSRCEIINNQTVQQTQNETIFTSKAVQVSLAERMRIIESMYRFYATQIKEKLDDIDLKTMAQNAQKRMKKEIKSYSLLQKGYMIEDCMRYLTIEKAMPDIFGMCLTQQIAKDAKKNLSIEEHLEHINEIVSELNEDISVGQYWEEKYNIPPEKRLFSMEIDEIPYLDITQEVVIPKKLKIHPAVHDLLTSYQNQKQ